MLITGSEGQLGTAFKALFPDAIAVDQPDLDLTIDDEVVSFVHRMRPSLVINCAAWTAVDVAENAEEKATKINGDAVALLAELSADIGARFVTFSTDYVFSGMSATPYVESDKTDPLNAYGRSKLVGEVEAMRLNPGSLVIRTAWLLSGTHDNFVATMLRLAAGGAPLRVVSDQVGSPTSVDDLASLTLRLLAVEANGIVHATNVGTTSWYGLAEFALAAAGLDDAELAPCATDEYPTEAKRPSYSVLMSERLATWGVNPMRAWEEAVVDIVEAQKVRLEIGG